MENNNNNKSISFSMTKPLTTYMRQAQASQPGLAPLYKSAALNLREYNGVPSMTARSLEKTMALLQLRPGRLVTQGLAPRKLLKAETAMPDAPLDCSSSNSSNSSNSETEEEQEDKKNESTGDVSDGNTTSMSTSSDDHNDNEGRHDLETEDHKRPIHTALAAAGIKLRPRETRPLLLALGVRPHRLVKLGLVDRAVLVRSSRHGGRGRGIGRGGTRHQQHGPPGRLAHRGGEGFGRPQHGPHPHPHPCGRDGRRSPNHRPHDRSSSPIHPPPNGPHGPPHGPCHRTDRHGGGHQREDGMQPFRDEPHGPRHHGGPDYAHGPPPGARKHPHKRPAHHLSGESDGERGVVHGGSPGGGPSRGHGGGHLGPPRHHGRPNHGRPNQDGGRLPNHGHGYHHPRHHHGEDLHSSGSEGEEGAEMRRGRGHHGGPRDDGEGRKCHRGLHNKRRLGSDREDWIGMMPEESPRWSSGSAGRHRHRSGGHHDGHQPPPPPPSPMVLA